MGIYGVDIESNFGVEGNALYGHDSAALSPLNGNVTLDRHVVNAFATPEQWIRQLGNHPLSSVSTRPKVLHPYSRDPKMRAKFRVYHMAIRPGLRVVRLSLDFGRVNIADQDYRVHQSTW